MGETCAHKVSSAGAAGQITEDELLDLVGDVYLRVAYTKRTCTSEWTRRVPLAREIKKAAHLGGLDCQEFLQVNEVSARTTGSAKETM